SALCGVVVDSSVYDDRVPHRGPYGLAGKERAPHGTVDHRVVVAQLEIDVTRPRVRDTGDLALDPDVGEDVVSRENLLDVGVEGAYRKDLKHHYSASVCSVRRTRGEPYSTGWAFSTRISATTPALSATISFM